MAIDFNMVNWIGSVLARRAGPTLSEDSIQLLAGVLRDNFAGRNFNAALRRLDERKSNARALRDLMIDTLQASPTIVLLIGDVSEYEHLTDQITALRAQVPVLPVALPQHRGELSSQFSDEPEDPYLVVSHVSRLMRAVLCNITQWPGIVVASSSGAVRFVPVRGAPPLESLAFVLRPPQELIVLGQLLEQLREEPLGPRIDLDRAFDVPAPRPSARVGNIERLHVVQISDVHLGSHAARMRTERLLQLLALLRSELDEPDACVIPVVTGDLMDSPSDSGTAEVRAFCRSLERIFGRSPIPTLGNHDVRVDGWRGDRVTPALGIEVPRITWIDEARVGLLTFNSVSGGRLARGRIGEAELQEAGIVLDRDPRAQRYLLVALVHHHPVPVSIPPWYQRTWYERLLGGWFERTEALEDADTFLQWLRHRDVRLVLHGHKHIPHFIQSESLAVVGAGSSVGNVGVRERGAIFVSINVVTIDVRNLAISCRLLAERLPGAGLVDYDHHELVYRHVVR